MVSLVLQCGQPLDQLQSRKPESRISGLFLCFFEQDQKGYPQKGYP